LTYNKLSIHCKLVHIGQNIIRLSSVDSTNNFVASMVKENLIQHGTVILAEEQTKGRGQLGTEWKSDKGKNLTFSIYLEPEKLSIQDQFLLSQFVSLCIIDMLSNFQLEPQVKWPNDILVAGKKICGVLIENQVLGSFINSSIVGVGLNVNQQHFPYPFATSMALCEGKEQNRNEVLNGILRFMNQQWDLLKSETGRGQIKDRYLHHLYEIGKQRLFWIKDVPFEGTITGVGLGGELAIRTSDGVRLFNLKEITFGLGSDYEGLQT
jgi:BirA family biotin operon repressor/biotin-[acetyl-CoA-carboxylase] ligase